MTATLTQPEVSILDEVSTPESTALVIDGVGYWVRTNSRGYVFAKEDPRTLGTAATYQVYVWAGQAVSCQCGANRYGRKTCKHMVAAAELLARW